MPSAKPREGRSLADIHPDLAEEWDYDKNELGPTEVTARNNRRVWWRCRICGHEWQAQIASRSNGRGCPACGRQKAAKARSKPREGQSLADLRPDLAEEWDHEKNGDLKPSDVKCGSKQKVWWVCKSCGYAWQATVKDRSNGNGCPACSGRAVWAGHNDLATVSPELTEEWNHDLNGDLKPSDATCGSNKRVWWKCGTCGCEWQATISSRSQGHGCPRCASNGTSFPEQAILFYVRKAFPDATSRSKVGGREADIAIPSIRTTIEYDGIAWHKDKEEKDAEKEKVFRKAGWRPIRVREAETDSVRTDGDTVWCPKTDSYDGLDETIGRTLALLGVANMDIDHGRDSVAIQEQYRGFLRKSSLAVTNPDLAAEWHQTRNGRLGPEMFLSGSHQKVWWVCKSCGYAWQATISSRSQGRGCPACSGRAVWAGHNDLAAVSPELLDEWDHERNELAPTEVTAHTNRKVWWICKTCGCEWLATVACRSAGTGCPVCARKKRAMTRARRREDPAA